MVKNQPHMTFFVLIMQKKLHQVHLHATDDGIELYKKAGFVPPKYPELVIAT